LRKNSRSKEDDKIKKEEKSSLVAEKSIKKRKQRKTVSGVGLQRM